MLRFTDNAKNWSIALLAAFPAFPLNWSTYIAAAATVFALPSLLLNAKKIPQEKWLLFFVWAFLFLWMSAYTIIEGSPTAFFEWEKSLGLMVFPFIFLLTYKPMGRFVHFSIPLIYVLALVYNILSWNGYFLLNGFRRKYFPGLEPLEVYRMEWNEITDFHPTYLTIMGWIAVYLLSRGLLNMKFGKLSLGFLLLLLILLAEMFVLSARLPLIIGAAGWIIFVLMTQAPFLKKWIFAGIILVGGLMGGIYKFSKDPRFMEFATEDTAGRENSFTFRKEIWNCSSTLAKENWLSGLGPENTEKELATCLAAQNRPVYTRITFNSHNQFLDYLLKYGIIAPLTLGLFLCMAAWQLIRKKMPEYVVILTVISAVLLTENFLTRQLGVFTFGFWIFGLLYYASFKEETNPFVKNPVKDQV